MNGFDKLKDCPHRVLFMGMMNEFPISSKELEEGEARFLQDAESNAACFGMFKPGHFMYMGPGSQKTCIQMTQKDNGMNWQSKLWMCMLYRSIPS